MLTLNTQSRGIEKSYYKNGHIFIEYFRVWLLCKFLILTEPIIFFLQTNDNNDTLVAPSHNANFMCIWREEKIFRGTTQKSTKLAKIFQRTDILLLFTCFLTSFNFCTFLLLLLYGSFFYSSYIHINYARLIIIMSYVHIRVERCERVFLLALKNWKNIYFFLMECVCAVSVINEHASALFNIIWAGGGVVYFGASYGFVVCMYFYFFLLNLLIFAPARSN